MADIQAPNLMQLRTFLHVAECGSVSKGALEMLRAQSVVTRSIADLEESLGVRLFERSPSGMKPTDYGNILLPRAKNIIKEIESLPNAHDSMTAPTYLYKEKRLRIFLSLCDTHHMQTVADIFGISQPAVSSTIKVMEEGFGFRLFERTTWGLQPTKKCFGVQYPVRRAVNELQHIHADIAAFRGTTQGIVHIGSLPPGRIQVLPEAISRLTEKFPLIKVVTFENTFENLATELRKGNIDLIFGALRYSPRFRDFQGEKLATEDFSILARKGHPLLGKILEKGHLEKAKWILPRKNSPAREMVDNSMAGEGVTPLNTIVESGDLAVIRGLLLHSNMLAVVSTQQWKRDIESGELCILPWKLQNTQRDIGLTYRHASLPSPAAQALMNAIRHACHT